MTGVFLCRDYGVAGEKNFIKKVGGKAEARQFLELGFVPGRCCTGYCEIGGNVIVNIRESRVAISARCKQNII